MKEMLKEMMKKKKDGEKLDPMYKDAKMGVLKEIRDMASNQMKGDLDNLKKVEVASDSEEGLEKGLDKAKEMLSDAPKEEEEAPMEEMLEGLSPEECEQLYKMLGKKLQDKEMA